MTDALLPPSKNEDLFELAALLEKQVALQEGLPHLHGWKWYIWARTFFESRNKLNFLCAANQISKSSTQIRKAIHWATATELWGELWADRPYQFWYLYPNKDTATIEFDKKWVPQFLPRGEYKNDPKYGWKEERKDRKIWAIHFFSGVSIYFKTYAQDSQDLQTGTVDAIFCDEELPVELYPELSMRLLATDGYFHMVFTATLGQEFWRCTMEEVDGADEEFVGALKLQISLFDCILYEDGSKSRWTKERIERAINLCPTEAEIQRRIFGRFVVTGGLKYPSFTRTQNILRDPGEVPEGYLYYSGVDLGAGGEDNHPAAIAMVAVRPDFRFGRVFRGWRGDGVVTTHSDVLVKHGELKKGLLLTAQHYDWHCKDFFTIASRAGETFTPADKSHATGESILNVLFKNKMLLIDDDPELKKLVGELTSLKQSTDKKRAKDDFTDALRYCVSKIPWDWSGVGFQKIETPLEELTPAQEEARKRRGLDGPQTLEEQLSAFTPEDELDEWQELMEG